MSEFQPIKGARHVNVGEDDANVVAALEDQNCFLCICRLDNIKPRSSDHVDRVGADQERILNNQTTGLCSRVGCFTMNLYVLQRRFKRIACCKDAAGAFLGKARVSIIAAPVGNE